MIDHNSRVLVTGVARGGIGEALIEKLVEKTNKIIITSLHMDESRFLSMKSLIKVQADCTTEKDIKKLENTIKESFSGIDYMVNCIGGSIKSVPPLEVSKEFFNTVIDVNLTSALLLTQMASRLMTNGGSIVHIGSSSAFEPEIKKMPYGIAKAGLNYLIKSTAMELAPQNITINSVSPTYVYTKRHVNELKKQAIKEGTTFDNLKNKKLEKQLLKSPLLPEDLVDTILFTLTNKIMTGKVIHATLGRIR